MKKENIKHNALEEIKVSLKVKLASLWTSLMFLIIYIDYFHLYMPSMIDDIQKGKVFVFEITQGFLVAGLTMVSIPALMIFLSIVLPAKANRWTNIIIAAINIPFMLFNLVGLAWIHMMFGAFVEVIILSIIIRYAWNWPRIEGRKI